MSSTQLVTVPELAKQVRVPAKWIRREAEAGRIPCLKAGRSLLFNPDAVRQTLARWAADPAEQARAEERQ